MRGIPSVLAAGEAPGRQFKAWRRRPDEDLGTSRQTAAAAAAAQSRERVPSAAGVNGGTKKNE